MAGPGVMQSDSGSSGTVDSAFQKQRLSDAVTVRGDRVDTGSIATGRFEVLDR
jgi:hypothetical protein